LNSSRTARSIAALVFSALLLGTIAWVSGCGGAARTVAPTPTVSATAATAPDSAAIQKYREALQKWVETYWTSADYGAFDIQDMLSPTDSERERMHAFADSMHASVSALKKITAPSPITQAQAQFYVAVASEVSSVDRLIMSIENQNRRDAELAFRRMSEARTVEIQAIKTLEPYLDLPAVIEN
jgi:hypothetical protein